MKGINQTDKAPVYPETCKKFLKLVSAELIERGQLMGDVFDDLARNIDINKLMLNCVSIIIQREYLAMEFNDYSLNGLFKIIEIIIIKYPGSLSKAERLSFIKFILNECLFKFENGILVDQARFKNPRLRRIAIDFCLSMLSQKYIKEQS
jgi:hypothetical protein